MKEYKLQQNGVLRTSDNMCIPNCGGNRHWREYQEWLAEGNTPTAEFSNAQKKANKLQADLKKLNDDMKSILELPVICKVGDKTYEMDGCEGAAIKLKNGIDLAKMLGETTIDIIDFHNMIHKDILIEDAEEIIKQQALYYRNAYYTKANERAVLLDK